MAGYLSATRGSFASYRNTPHSTQIDTITTRLPNPPLYQQALRPLSPGRIPRSPMPGKPRPGGERSCINWRVQAAVAGLAAWRVPSLLRGL